MNSATMEFNFIRNRSIMTKIVHISELKACKYAKFPSILVDESVANYEWSLSDLRKFMLSKRRKINN